MGRSIKKGPYIHPKLEKKVQAVLKSGQSGKKASIKTWSRSSTIIPDMVGLTFAVHNGKDFITVSVVENMVGHKLGEFSPTRKFFRHGGRMAKEQAQAAAVAEKSQVEKAQATTSAPVKK